MAQTLEAVFVRGHQDRADYVPSGADVDNGDIVDLGETSGVCTSPEGIEDGRTGSLAVSGVFRVIKDGSAGPIFARGVDVFWDTVNRLAVTAAGANIIRLGVSDKAAGASEDGVDTILNQPLVQS
jgi:predicted RecA/RadA family phage recombinase